MSNEQTVESERSNICPIRRMTLGEDGALHDGPVVRRAMACPFAMPFFNLGAAADSGTASGGPGFPSRDSAMPMFYFHIANDVPLTDKLGALFPSPEQAISYAETLRGALARKAPLEGHESWRVVVSDERGEIVFETPSGPGP
jgi:hypothetical protein